MPLALMITNTRFSSLLLTLPLFVANSFTTQSCCISYRKSKNLVALLSGDSDINENDDPVSMLPLMEAELALCKDEAEKDALESKISDAKISAEFGVRRAQSKFYDCFTQQDVSAMKKVWSSREDIRCVHPGMTSLEGVDAIMTSWEQIFSGSQAFTIEPSRTKIDICGQTALCSCIEETPGGGKLECLNIYRREDGDWKMILHMASPIVVSSAFF